MPITIPIPPPRGAHDALARTALGLADLAGEATLLAQAARATADTRRDPRLDALAVLVADLATAVGDCAWQAEDWARRVQHGG